VPVAYTCNPSYSGCRDQEDLSQANSWRDPISKNLLQNRAGGVAQGEGSEYKPQFVQTHKKEQQQQDRPDVIAHICNPSYSEGRDREDCCSRPARAVSSRDPISINKPGMVVCACHPSYLGGIGSLCGQRWS
jgi:hypothetical protein